MNGAICTENLGLEFDEVLPVRDIFKRKKQETEMNKHTHTQKEKIDPVSELEEKQYLNYFGANNLEPILEQKA